MMKQHDIEQARRSYRRRVKKAGFVLLCIVMAFWVLLVLAICWAVSRGVVDALANVMQVVA